MVNVIATQMALGRAPWVVPRRATRLALKRAFYELSFRISYLLRHLVFIAVSARENCEGRIIIKYLIIQLSP